jgi:hypothetical protein
MAIRVTMATVRTILINMMMAVSLLLFQAVAIPVIVHKGIVPTIRRLAHISVMTVCGIPARNRA